MSRRSKHERNLDTPAEDSTTESEDTTDIDDESTDTESTSTDLVETDRQSIADHDEQAVPSMTDSTDTLPDSNADEADNELNDEAIENNGAADVADVALGTDEWWSDFDDLADDTTSSMYSVVYPSTSVERNVALETLWFRLADQGFSTTGLVPVPDVTGAQALEFAQRLARVGASITGQPIRLVEAMRLAPADAQVAVEVVADGGDTPMLVVVDSPTFDTAAIPVLRSCERTVLLVGLGESETDNLTEITSLVGADQVAGAVCIDRPRPRRFWQRKPRQNR